MDRGAWWAMVHRVAKSQIWLKRLSTHPTPVLLPGKSHGWRSLVGCSPWGRWWLDMTERLHFHFSLARIGEGNGNPLQCSCLENPRDRGAWWASVYGVAQSRTRLKWLSSSSSSIELMNEWMLSAKQGNCIFLFFMGTKKSNRECSLTLWKGWTSWVFYPWIWIGKNWEGENNKMFGLFSAGAASVNKEHPSG